MIREVKTRLDAAFCVQKRALATREEAEALARQHYACSVCSTTGWKMHAYVCPATDSEAPHWHIGHGHP